MRSTWKGGGFTRLPINQVDSFDKLDPGERQTVRIYRDWWWVVTPQNEVLLFNNRVPQANPQRQVTELMVGRYEGCRAKKLSLVIIPEH